MIFNMTAPGGGSSVSGWTDVTDVFGASFDNNPDIVYYDIKAYTDGTVVFLSGAINRDSSNYLTLPEGYESSVDAVVGSAIDSTSGEIAAAYVGAFTDRNEFDVMTTSGTSSNAFYFTIIYPVAS